MKKVIIGVAIIIALIVGYWLISPLFITIEADEPLPIAKDVGVEAPAVEDVVEEAQPVVEPAVEKVPATDTSVKPEVPDDEPAVDTSSIEEVTAPLEEPTVLAQGSFTAKAHKGEGMAKVIETGGKTYLRFENFETDNGPDLKIYLSTDEKASDFVDLGEIKATKGNVNYEVPAGTDIDKYNNVLVWCRAFSVLFTSAALS